MKPTITLLSHTRARIDADSGVVSVLDDALAIRIKDAWRSQTASSGAWDGKKHLLTPSGTFPAGLVEHAKKKIEETGYSCRVVNEVPVSDALRAIRAADITEVPKKLLHDKKNPSGWLELRPDQQKGILRCVKWERGIVWSATGTGKTEIAIGLVALLMRHAPITTLFFTHRKKLARDTRKRFARRLGVKVEDIGFIADGKWEEGTLGVVIAVIDTLKQKRFKKRRAEFFARVDLLILDECHHAASASWYQLIQRCRAPFRIGLSGTPIQRSDQKDLMLVGATGPVRHKLSMKRAMELGIITPVDITIVPIRKTSEPLPEDASWPTPYKIGVVDNTLFHDEVARRVKDEVKKGHSVLILLRELRHGMLQMQALDRIHVPHTEFVHGKLNEEEQDDIVAKFSKGIIKALVATTFLGEGIDIPAANRIHLCDSVKALITLIQNIGRGVRTKDGKDNCGVTDYAHLTNRYLARHALARIKIYKSWGLIGGETDAKRKPEWQAARRREVTWPQPRSGTRSVATSRHAWPSRKKLIA